MVALDTAVLIYAKGDEHPLREPCRRLVEAIGGGRLRATTTPEVIQEFVHVRSRRRPRFDALRLGRDFAELLGPLLTVRDDHLLRGLSLYEGHPRLGAFDAALVATAIGNGATAIVSADRGFEEVKEIEHVFPDEDGVERLLVAHGA